METIIKRVNVQSALVLIPLALLSLLTPWGGRRFALGVLVGGLVAASNLKGLAWSVTALIGVERPQGKIVFLSIFRLLVVFAFLLVLAALKAIDLFGLLLGLTVVFIIILKEGLVAARNGERLKTKS
ncbi:MAG: hypothetical protein AB1805_07940 [Nitrospirota bacterium]